MDRLKYNIIPKAVDNLQNLLDKGDKAATIETVKGTIFKSYQAAEGFQEGSQTILAIKVEYPEGIPVTQAVIEGQIVGRPKLIAPVSKAIPAIPA